MKLLVTGGAGYIGSVVTSQLLDGGHEAVVLDDLSKGHEQAIPEGAKSVEGDLLDKEQISEVLSGGFDGVLHFAALSLVGESVEQPERYYRNNVCGTLNLLEAMAEHGASRLVCSSTAAVYGEPEEIPIKETDPALPTNPYGASKLAADRLIGAVAGARGLAAVSLRYFNVAGARGRFGEDHQPETHLIPLVLKAASGEWGHIDIYGTDVSRIASRLEEQQKEWRGRSLEEKEYPYLYLDATYLKVRWGTRVSSMALLACVGVDEEGFREVLAVEVAGSEKGAAYASLLRDLLDRGLKGVRLVISDDHEGIKAAVAGELPGAEWQRCAVHFQRNVLSHVLATSMAEVAEDLSAIFKVRREKTAQTLAEEFVELYAKSYPKAVSVFEVGIKDALTYLRYPGSHHARIRTTNMLERLFKEVKRRTRVVGVFPNETSAATLATEIVLRSSEEWALRCYLTMDALKAVGKPNPQLSRH